MDVEIKLFAGCNKFMLKSAHQTLTALNLNTADVSYWITGFAEFKCISPCFYFQVLDKDPSVLKELALMSKWIQEKSLSLQWRKVIIIIMFKCICQHCQSHKKLFILWSLPILMLLLNGSSRQIVWYINAMFPNFWQTLIEDQCSSILLGKCIVPSMDFSAKISNISDGSL